MHLLFCVLSYVLRAFSEKDGGCEGWIMTLYNFHMGSPFLHYFLFFFFFLGEGVRGNDEHASLYCTHRYEVQLNETTFND